VSDYPRYVECCHANAFYQPWTGRKIYRRIDAAFAENICADNNEQFAYHIPVASRPDFRSFIAQLNRAAAG